VIGQLGEAQDAGQVQRDDDDERGVPAGDAVAAIAIALVAFGGDGRPSTVMPGMVQASPRLQRQESEIEQRRVGGGRGAGGEVGARSTAENKSAAAPPRL